MMEWLGLPVVASEHGPQLDYFTLLIHWLMAVLFVGWGAFFLYTLVRFRAGLHPKADYTGVRSHYSSFAEVGVGVAEILLLVLFAIPAWAMRVDQFPSHQESTVVRVIAEQFLWNFHYPGADGEFGRTDIALMAADNPIGLDRNSPHGKDDIVSPVLNLPIDKPAILEISSKDVIHSFGLPNFRVKQDAIPGLMTPVWFKPTRAGEYEIACSQLCGLGHYRMRGFITIQSAEDYQKWLTEQAAEQ